MVEVIMNAGLGGGELLETSQLLKPRHRSLTSSERQMQVFCAVVFVPTGDLMTKPLSGNQLNHNLLTPIMAS